VTLQILDSGRAMLAKTWGKHPIFSWNGHCYSLFYMSDTADFDFRHHLRDTIILLGGKQEIADLLVKSQDGQIKEADIDSLRNYNIGLFTATKQSLNSLNKLKLAPAREAS
jgi:hypothetical protein